MCFPGLSILEAEGELEGEGVGEADAIGEVDARIGRVMCVGGRM